MIKIYYLTPEVRISRLKRKLADFQRHYDRVVACNDYYLKNKTLVGYPDTADIDFEIVIRYIKKPFVFDERLLPYSQELVKCLEKLITETQCEIEEIAQKANIDSHSVSSKLGVECMTFNKADVCHIKVFNDDGGTEMDFGFRHSNKGGTRT